MGEAYSKGQETGTTRASRIWRAVQGAPAVPILEVEGREAVDVYMHQTGDGSVPSSTRVEVTAYGVSGELRVPLASSLVPYDFRGKVITLRGVPFERVQVEVRNASQVGTLNPPGSYTFAVLAWGREPSGVTDGGSSGAPVFTETSSGQAPYFQLVSGPHELVSLEWSINDVSANYDYWVQLHKATDIADVSAATQVAQWRRTTRDGALSASFEGVWSPPHGYRVQDTGLLLALSINSTYYAGPESGEWLSVVWTYRRQVQASASYVAPSGGGRLGGGPSIGGGGVT